ncbi:hypothetical protein LK09_12125 [Microbacterium mangrovi]|uniref:Uncharacterized protein n=1 Tax=Microbacterium mangrovi TaxID=1348253 RepID=A0A0B2A366_9MICO|nr:hypothetical protein [Microbacterium mangrovi]KHK97490.1 hypothetical protein LK09_12125 [Microbacterium mangrovi]
MMHTIESAAPVREHDDTLSLPDTGRLTAVAHDERLSLAERAHLRLALWLLLSGARRASTALDRDAHRRRVAEARAAQARTHDELHRAFLRS